LVARSEVRAHVEADGGTYECVVNIMTHLNVLLTEEQRMALNWHPTQSISLVVMRMIDEWQTALRNQRRLPTFDCQGNEITGP
jgi:hypothetical protein